ncbi:Z1 domain-containing protein [Pseudolysinimonas yzui]|uniref:Endonuclease n=1 Tax=Pseudolysinimonas yzui TaxID=2708254 RepID=A0A8J3M137_9MICO|nr:Z1 domain-containing protein [Pseudolysinimonas yzui]GHF11786.1 endonuclease [Pseudolysinimonas yzui]
MTQSRPDWADGLTNALTGIRHAPKPILRLLEIHAGRLVSEAEFAEFVTSAAENDPALVQLRLDVAGWDSDESLDTTATVDGPTPPHTAARRDAICRALELEDMGITALTRRVPIFEKAAIVISKKFEPWYREARKKRTTVYWDDYETYLRDVKKWEAEAIASLDQTTTDVIERLSDPTRAEIKQTKGLVVGYVQSGKTANFTGVVAKAVDAGYRLIIVLTGTIEILRAQTQRRMDMELMGVENILAGQDPSDATVAKELDYQQDEDWIAQKFVRHGAALEQQGVVHISRVTTHRDDYKRLPQGLTRLKFLRTDKSKLLNDESNLFNTDAYVAVIKKNSAPLTKLIKDLTPLKDDLAQLPVLIIDDESDQASVDTTNPDKFDKPSADDRKRSTINKLITQILQLCPRAQYVGYTATPFANVFVDPDDERDLFPADFVLSLRRPPGYMGVQDFHDVGKRWDDDDKTIATSNELAYVRSLVGDAEHDPDARRSEIQAALDAWVLSGAIKKYRESVSDLRYRHHTMLVHESVSRADHSDAASDVRTIWKTSGFASADGLARLQRLFESDFAPVMEARAEGSPVPASFGAIRPYVADALQEMTSDGDPILVVNSDKAIQDQQKKLDFEADKVWRILVGGTQLSRGFTVEGLTVSYFRRKAGQADTLMQAGRWFGFRPGYRDLVRLYIRRDQTVDLYEAFEALLLDEEALRDELRVYEGFDEDGMPLVEPRQIPPLVSQHLPWLRPTARNKMWNAVIESKAAASGVQDRYSVPPRGDAGNERNLLGVASTFVGSASSDVGLQYVLADGSMGVVDSKFGVLSAAEFLHLFQKLEWHPQYEEVVRPFTTFLEKATNDGRINEWAVVWPQPSKTVGRIKLSGVDAPVIRRGRRTGGRIDFVGSDQKHRSAVEPIARGEAVVGLAGAEGRGVALLYLVDDRDQGSPDELNLTNVIPLISMAVPTSSTPHKRDLIQWTVRVKAKSEDAVVEKD